MIEPILLWHCLLVRSSQVFFGNLPVRIILFFDYFEFWVRLYCTFSLLPSPVALAEITTLHRICFYFPLKHILNICNWNTKTPQKYHMCSAKYCVGILLLTKQFNWQKSITTPEFQEPSFQYIINSVHIFIHSISLSCVFVLQRFTVRAKSSEVQRWERVF